MAEHLTGGAAKQPVGVVDAVHARQHRVGQGQQASGQVGGAGPIAQVDQRIGGLLDAQPLGQRGGQQQARIGHGVGVVEADIELVEGVGARIEKVPSGSGSWQLSQAPFSQVRGLFS